MVVGAARILCVLAFDSPAHFCRTMEKKGNSTKLMAT
jgi:hypothetical protein